MPSHSASAPQDYIYITLHIIWVQLDLASFSPDCTDTLLNMSVSPAMNARMTEAADCGCGGGLDFAPMHAIRSVGQCDIPSLSPRGGGARRPLL